MLPSRKGILSFSAIFTYTFLFSPFNVEIVE